MTAPTTSAGVMPRLIILHSAGTTPAKMQALVGPIEGFDVVYPQASKDLRWDHLGDTDVPALMALGGDYIAGYSSGGFMGLRMCAERQYRAAMVVAAGIIKASKPRPTPLMLINGTADRQVPYDGTKYVYGALNSAIAMRRLLGVTSSPTHTTIPNTSKLDGCTTYVDDWAGMVKLYTVIGGGHTWPGSKFNAFGIGKTCMDFSATSEMRAFFGGVG